MVVVTGGAGFIGSAIIWNLNCLGQSDNIVVDELETDEKWKNLNGLKFAEIFHKDHFMEMILDETVPFEIDAIFHMGACSSTMEKDGDFLLHNNFRYSVELAKYSLAHDVRYIYASSAATYGDGSKGYDDDEDNLDILRPLNIYGYSKQLFDVWVKRNDFFKNFVGLKFFNVYGPNEFHKEDMRSVVNKAFEQACGAGKVKLFKSYSEEYKDGEQMRDFIYVKDAVDMTLFFYENKDKNGLFNIGTGKARTWNDLAAALFSSMDKHADLEYVDMPLPIRSKYQYYTEANINKLRNAGFDKKIHTLEEGVADYVGNYLLKEYYLGMC